MGDQDRLAVAAKQHQIALPMAQAGAGVNLGGPLMNRHPVLDVIDRSGTYSEAPAPGFVPRQ